MSPARLDQERSAIRSNLIADLFLLDYTVSLLSWPELITHVTDRGAYDLDLLQTVRA
jgi:hypothetical protein